MGVYQVKDWDKHFENFKSREYNSLTRVSVPNKQTGDGFTYILCQPDGLAILGAWYLLVEALSLQPIPRAGYCTDTGRMDGKPWTAALLARRWRRGEKEIQRMFDVITCADVAWINEDTNRIPTGYQPDTERVPKDTTLHYTTLHLNTTPLKHNSTSPLSAAADAQAAEKAFLTAWNVLPAPFAKIQEWNNKRKTVFKARYGEPYFREHWQAGIVKMRDSTFCRGGGSSGWVASVEFFLRPGSLAKILEGNYDGNGKRSTPPARTGPTGAELAEQREIIERTKQNAERDRLQYERDLRDACVSGKPNGNTAGPKMVQGPKISSLPAVRSVVPRLKSVPKIG